MEVLKCGQSCIFGTPTITLRSCHVYIQTYYFVYAGSFSISITFIHTVTPAPVSVWDNLRVNCLAQWLVGRCSGKYSYMWEPMHRFLHRAHLCRSHLTVQMSHYYCRIENPSDMITQQALWLSCLKINSMKRQSL